MALFETVLKDRQHVLRYSQTENMDCAAALALDTDGR